MFRRAKLLSARAPRFQYSVSRATLAPQTVIRIPAMVSNDQDSHRIAGDSVQEVIGEAFEIDSPQVCPEKMVSGWPSRSVEEKTTQFTIEVLGQFSLPGLLVILHDLIHIGADAPMQNKSHVLWRLFTCESRSRRVIA